MGVKVLWGCKNDRKRRGVCLSAGSINLCTDTVQAAFLCKADKTRVSLTNRFANRKLYLRQPGWSIHQQESEIWHLGPEHLYWLLLVSTSCNQKSGMTTCVNVAHYEPLQLHLFRLLPSSWDILMICLNEWSHVWLLMSIFSTHGEFKTHRSLSACVRFWAFHREKTQKTNPILWEGVQLQKNSASN